MLPSSCGESKSCQIGYRPRDSGLLLEKDSQLRLLHGGEGLITELFFFCLSYATYMVLHDSWMKYFDILQDVLDILNLKDV
jgi:hypothetical protein